jgi:hypothetical protein
MIVRSFVADLERGAHRQQSVLPRDGKPGVLPIDHRTAVGPTHFPSLLDKKLAFDLQPADLPI